MRIEATPWFAVPVGALVLGNDGVTWYRLVSRESAESVTVQRYIPPGSAFPWRPEIAVPVAPSATVRVAVPDLVDILRAFNDAGLPAVPLAIDVPAEHLDLITKREKGPQWLSQRRR